MITEDVSRVFKKQEGEKSCPSSYLCKICSKKFVSGRALGGHMGGHAPAFIAADTLTENECRKRPRASDRISIEKKNIKEGLDSNGSNLMYALRRNPNSSCLFSDRDDSFLLGQGFDSKRVGSSIISCDLRANEFQNLYEHFSFETNNEEKDMAKCLVSLANGASTAQSPQFQAAAEESGSGDLKNPNTGSQLLKCIKKKQKFKKIVGDAGLYDDGENKKAMHKCTTCNKSFHSHQALGGHRASHNRVNRCFSQIQEKQSQEENITGEELIPGMDFQLPYSFHKVRPKEKTKDFCVKKRDKTTTIEAAAFSGKKTPRVHECPICDRVFPSGQALGGHKRCHWSGAGSSSDTVSTISSNKDAPLQQEQMLARVELFDLNLPASVDDDCYARNLNTLGSNVLDSHGFFNAQNRSAPHLRSWLTVMNDTKQGLGK